MNVNLVKDSLGVSYGTANDLVGAFAKARLLRETTGAKRGRVFRYDPYLDLLSEDAVSESPRPDRDGQSAATTLEAGSAA